MSVLIAHTIVCKQTCKRYQAGKAEMGLSAIDGGVLPDMKITPSLRLGAPQDRRHLPHDREQTKPTPLAGW
ncbi:hypothetical protein [uncultured Roseibium sp.]|uniref:hypothetical protein n=1 Tax=uncultured Roseibium sp. TaxID=1936171 RepID=UPI00260DA339|nr:hypothetical protein [uncultured Roseibium sp.]